mgnify:CR=1 FL=1
MQLALFAPAQPNGITIHTNGERHTISRGNEWWTGVGWTSDERMAIGLHGSEILQSELSRYFAGETE